MNKQLREGGFVTTMSYWRLTDIFTIGKEANI